MQILFNIYDIFVGGVGMFEVTSGAPLREKRTLKNKEGEAFKKLLFLSNFLTPHHTLTITI